MRISLPTIALGFLASPALAATLTVTTTADSGPGSLRQAILDSNASAGVPDTIAFAIGSGVQTITPLSALPTVTDPVVIDGTTQPGYSGTPLVEIAGAGLPAQGLQITAGGSTVRALVIRDFNATGIWLQTGGGNTIERCFVGTDATGTQPRSNSVGIYVASSAANTIGGSTPAARNLVSGNDGIGILLSGAPSTIVAGNFVGTDVTGTLDLGNGTAGIFLVNGSDDAVIGGTAGTTPSGPCTGACNLVSGNQGSGIDVTGSSTANARVHVQGNFVGTDAAGMLAVPNGGFGVRVGGGSSDALVGGTSPAARNLISGNASTGLVLGSGGGGAHTVQGNYIGTDTLGAAALPNGGYGVYVELVPGMHIGGGAAGAGNLISGNALSGVYLAGVFTSVNLVQGNLIGTDASGLLPLGNGSYGVAIIGSSNNTIGGPAPGEGNLIAHNTVRGVHVSGATGNAIRGNAIFDHAELAIDLIPQGVTANDPGDGDTGANELQNWPVLTSVEAAAPSGGSTRFQGVLHSAASTTYDLDFYENPPCAPFPREYVEAQTYLGAGQVTTDAAGTGTIDVTLPVSATAGARFAATATDPAGNTSEISQRIVFSLAPAAGAAAGGTSIVISGSDFLAGAAVSIGGQPASGVNVGSFTSITATTPALAAGTANDVVVSNTDGTVGRFARGWVADFLDVPPGHLFHNFVATLVGNAITAGVGGGLYGVNDDTLRQQMAVFLLKARHGLCYTPPPCSGAFADVPCPSQFANWIEALAAEGITAGCGGSNYCPQNPVRRDQMAVFLLKAEHGSGYSPPPCSGTFADVPCPSLFANWIEQLAAESITGGCGGGNYCPSDPNTRGQMAVFIVKTFGLL
jgi:hypothetical protein